MPTLRRFSTPPGSAANDRFAPVGEEWTLVDREQPGSTASYWPALGAHNLYPNAYPPPLVYRQTSLPPGVIPPQRYVARDFPARVPAIRVAPPTPQGSGHAPSTTQPFFTPTPRVNDEKAPPPLPFPLIPPRTSSRASTAPSVNMAPSASTSRASSSLSAGPSSSLAPSTPSSPSLDPSPTASKEHVPHDDRALRTSQRAYAALVAKHSATLDAALKTAQALADSQSEVRALRDRLAQCQNVMQMLVDWGRLLRNENELLREQAGADPGVALWEPDLSTLFPDPEDAIEELKSEYDLDEVF